MHMSQAAHGLTPSPDSAAEQLQRLVDFVRTNSPLFVLTGAGCSTESGIPDYRDSKGHWKHARPVQYRDFVQHHQVRQRYWARSMLGYHRIADATPNRAHRSLAELERLGVVSALVTQNVDGLHQRASQHNVIELHGSLATVRCLNCDARYSRRHIQSALTESNPALRDYCVNAAPDGDAQLEHADFSDFSIPHCRRCNGVLKPDVVFFGESVPKQRVSAAFSWLQQARGMMVVGTSLFVYSGYRFARFACGNNIPIAAINQGATRADKDFSVKFATNCSQALHNLLCRMQ